MIKRSLLLFNFKAEKTHFANLRIRKSYFANVIRRSRLPFD